MAPLAQPAAAQAGGPSERSALLEGITAARCRVLRPFVEQSLSDEHPGVWQAAVQSALAVGDASVCALLVTGVARCRGSNRLGQLGEGTVGPLPGLAPDQCTGEIDAENGHRGQLALVEFAALDGGDDASGR